MSDSPRKTTFPRGLVIDETVDFGPTGVTRTSFNHATGTTSTQFISHTELADLLSALLEETDEEL